MQVPDEAVYELIAIYKEEYGEELNRSEASEMALRIVTLYRLLARKLPNEKISEPKPLDESHQMGFLA